MGSRPDWPDHPADWSMAWEQDASSEDWGKWKVPCCNCGADVCDYRWLYTFAHLFAFKLRGTPSGVALQPQRSRKFGNLSRVFMPIFDLYTYCVSSRVCVVAGPGQEWGWMPWGGRCLTCRRFQCHLFWHLMCVLPNCFRVISPSNCFRMPTASQARATASRRRGMIKLGIMIRFNMFPRLLHWFESFLV